VGWTEKAWSFLDLSQTLAKAGTGAEPYSPLSICRFDRDPAWVSAMVLYELAAKQHRFNSMRSSFAAMFYNL
jgi:hypothetical protein